MYVVNAPFAFRACWSIIKGFLDEKTVAKISIIGGGFQKTLLEVIDENCLPDFLGGKSTCTTPGGWAMSDVGPWDQYEPVFPFGIKPKGQKEEPKVQEVVAENKEEAVQQVVQAVEELAVAEKIQQAEEKAEEKAHEKLEEKVEEQVQEVVEQAQEEESKE